MVDEIYDLGEAEELLEALEDFQEFIPYMIFILKFGIRCRRLHAEENGTIIYQETPPLIV